MWSPVGSEPPSTYWRRRAAVVVALLVVVWLVWWLLSAALGSDGEPDPEPSTPPPAQNSQSPAPAAAAGDPPHAESGDAVTAAGSSAEPTAPACATSAVMVDTELANPSTDVGQGMEVTMSVTNAGDAACRRDIGPGASEITITSGSVLVWSSDFCDEAGGTNAVTLAPGEVVTTSVTWPGRVTTQDCPAAQPEARVGTYRAVSSNQGVASEPVVFTVQ